MLPSKRHHLFFVVDVLIAVTTFILAGTLLVVFIVDEHRHIGQVLNAVLFACIGGNSTNAAFRHRRLKDHHSDSGL